MDINYFQDDKTATRYPPKYGRVFFDIFLAYFFIVSNLTINIVLHNQGIPLWSSISLMVLSGILNAFFLHFILLTFHEAGHYNLLRNKTWNDILANFLIGYWFLWDVKRYRKIHWDHHLKLGGMDDPENSYFSPLTFKNMLLALTGFYSSVKLRERHAQANQYHGLEEHLEKRAWSFFVLYNVVVFAVFFKNQAYLQYLVIWLFPLVCGVPFFSLVRQTCEHRRFDSGQKEFSFEEHGPHSRLFRKTVFSHFMGGAGFTLHWYHHLNPYISYTRLQEFSLDFHRNVPRLTQETRFPVGSLEKQTTYLNTFIHLVKDAWRNQLP